MSEIAVSIDHVSKRFRIYHERNQSIKQVVLRRRRGVYEEFWAVNDVTVDIPRGCTYGFIGVNGSGDRLSSGAFRKREHFLERRAARDSGKRPKPQI